MNDNDDMLTTMRDVLEMAGASVRTATTAMEAYSILGSGFAPDIFVLDLVLSRGERGEDVAQVLRHHPSYGATPIVFLSGAVSSLRAYSPGLADAALTKPFAIDDLYDQLAGLCARHEQVGPRPHP